jgi:hypothetical protein
LTDFTATRVEVASSRQLPVFLDLWQGVVANAAEPNIFYEPLTLLPAIDHFGAGRDSRFVFVIGTPRSDYQEIAIGFFPLQRVKHFRGVPLEHYAAWQHPQMYLANPLIHARHGVTAFRLFLKWLRGHGCPLLEWPLIHADGKTARALHAASGLEAQPIMRVDRFERALLKRHQGNGQEYTEQASSAASRREWRRQRRRLAELGTLEVRGIRPNEPAGPWLDRLLALEAKGWKGANGTALLSSRETAMYFRTVCEAAHASGRLHLLGLFLDNELVAIQSNIFAVGGAFALQVAYNEAFAKYSPGVQLELENIVEMFARPDFAWLDSCTRGRHPLMHRLWRDRRRIDHYVVATGGLKARLIVKLFPHAQRIKRALQPVPG